MIQLMHLFPDHLDLNGDGGNILILERRIAWSGLSSNTLHLLPGQVPSIRPDILLIGHGSTAAWRQIYSEFARLVPIISEWMKQGTQVLAVSSGYAALHGLLPELPVSINRVERQSKFVEVEFEGQEVYGYLNSDLELEVIARQGQLLGSLLHGPLLAKNSWIADSMIDAARADQSRGQVNSKKLDQIEALAVAARKLAREQANV